MTLKDGKNQRTKQTRTDASYVNYGYDNYGQVQTALGYTSGGTPITSEQYGYAYDAAWNLLRLTNNGAVTTRSYNSLNQLPSPPYGDYTYDANGNLTAVGSRAFTYDDENQLVSVADTMYQKTAFTYDAKGRLRIRQEYSWVNSMWSLTDTINYVYDGMLAIQMRGASISSYTRGLDLSLSLQGAGGIGGLLAQTASGAHSYYHSDGNGNITYLMKADQSLGASYRYDDAYGNVVTISGTLANPFRFSSKEWLPRISAYYFGYRFYYPSIQRWLNRDPIEEKGGINLYGFVDNYPVNWIDPFGLCADPKTVECFLNAQIRFIAGTNRKHWVVASKHSGWFTVSVTATVGIIGAYGVTGGGIVATAPGEISIMAIAVNDVFFLNMFMHELEEIEKDAKNTLKKNLDKCVAESSDPDAQKEANKIYNRINH